MGFRSLPLSWINAAVVFVGRRIVSQHAEQSGQNREAIYRDARLVRQQLEDGEQRERQLQAKLQQLREQNARLQNNAEHNPFTDPDKVDQYAAMAQAEGVSLPVAQRLLKILQAKTHGQSVRSGGVRSGRK